MSSNFRGRSDEDNQSARIIGEVAQRSASNFVRGLAIEPPDPKEIRAAFDKLNNSDAEADNDEAEPIAQPTIETVPESDPLDLSLLLADTKPEKPVAKEPQATDAVALPLKELYDTGLAMLTEADFQLVRDRFGDNCLHYIYVCREPKEIKGITYPTVFKPVQHLDDDGKGLDKIRQLFEEQPGRTEPWVELKRFWEPLYTRDNSDKTLLYRWTDGLLSSDENNAAAEAGSVLDFGQTFDPSGELVQNGCASNPRVWVPARSWFDPAIQKVKLSDIFTLLPEAELRLMSLFLGRLGVGPTNHVPSGPGWHEAIQHTYRMAVILYGRYQGQGKSTLAKKLIAGLSRCGFSSATFRDVSDRFGGADVARADLAYKDDTSRSMLKGFVSSVEAKELISGAMVQVEEKHKNATTVSPKAVFWLNTNEWCSEFERVMDSGMTDRTKVLSCFSNKELARLQAGETVGGRSLIGSESEGTPDIKPTGHIKWLADKLNCEPEALMLWCVRLAVDDFWRIIYTDQKANTQNQLEIETRRWTTRLRKQLPVEATQSLVQMLVLSRALRAKDPTAYDMPQLTSLDTLIEHIRDYQFVVADKSCFNIRELMKDRWEAEGRAQLHYWSGNRAVSPPSLTKLLKAHNEMEFNEFGTPKAQNEAFGLVLKHLTMRDGNQPPSSATDWIDAWTEVRADVEDLRREAKLLRDAMSDEEVIRLLDDNASPTLDWLNDRSYSPDKAQKLAPQMK